MRPVTVTLSAAEADMLFDCAAFGLWTYVATLGDRLTRGEEKAAKSAMRRLRRATQAGCPGWQPPEHCRDLDLSDKPRKPHAPT
jgi:hypothetical protein